MFGVFANILIPFTAFEKLFVLFRSQLWLFSNPSRLTVIERSPEFNSEAIFVSLSIIPLVTMPQGKPLMYN